MNPDRKISVERQQGEGCTYCVAEVSCTVSAMRQGDPPVGLEGAYTCFECGSAWKVLVSERPIPHADVNAWEGWD